MISLKLKYKMFGVVRVLRNAEWSKIKDLLEQNSKEWEK